MDSDGLVVWSWLATFQASTIIGLWILGCSLFIVKYDVLLWNVKYDVLEIAAVHRCIFQQK